MGLGLALLLAAPTYAGKVCFDLRGVSTGPSRGGVQVGGDTVVTDIPAGTNACDAMADWKADWDATPGNASEPITQRPDGTCDWCITRAQGRKPTSNIGRGIGHITNGFSRLSNRFVANPDAPAPAPVTIQVTVVVQAPAGGVIEIVIEITVNNQVQRIRIVVQTFRGMQPMQVNQMILSELQRQGFDATVGQGEFPELGHCQTFDIYGHVSGAPITGAEVACTDPWLNRWGLYAQGAEEPCDGDLNGDGVVDLADLGIVLSDYGCNGANCAGDADGDGDTDLADLGIVLANFGSLCS